MPALRAVNQATRKTNTLFSRYKKAVKIVALRTREAEQQGNQASAMRKVAKAETQRDRAIKLLSVAWAEWKKAKALKQVPQTTIDHMERTGQLRLSHITPSQAEEIEKILQGSNPEATGEKR